MVELIDLYCDGRPKGRSLDQGASVALPYLRYSARFAAHFRCKTKPASGERSPEAASPVCSVHFDEH
jgi:hypothetical protein